MWDKKTEVVLFASTAIASYGYDQGMMSLVNTNAQYLQTMGISEASPLVGIIVSVYYLGCAVGAILASYLADKAGRKWGIFVSLVVTALGNLLMFLAGIGSSPGGLIVMLFGRVVMGLGVGGIDSVIPTYSSELCSDGGRGEALAKEFQSNIFGLNMAFAINLIATQKFGKNNQWAWRIPILAMQIYPLILLSFITRLPESPRWCIAHDKKDDARNALSKIYNADEVDERLEDLNKAAEEESSSSVSYGDMIYPSGKQFHETIVTVMGQINQALTGYGAVSVYGPQIFELLGLGVTESEYLTQGNYVSYFALMTFAWLLIDRVGRRPLMLWGAFGIGSSFLVLTVLGALAAHAPDLGIAVRPVSIVGAIVLFIATGMFGVGWLSEVWLIPTEIYPSASRAQGAAVSVVIWGLSNFSVTLLTPILFNNLKYWLFLIFAATNAFAGVWTWLYSPETGGRSFEENQAFFEDAKEQNTWSVLKVNDGEFRTMPTSKEEDPEREPLLS